MRSRVRPSTSACTRAENSPVSERNAERAADSDPASMRSATASAWARSSLPFKNARSENSPGRARRAPSASARPSTMSSTTGPPWPCSSSTSSPVNECGAGKKSARPRSIGAPAASRKFATVAWRGHGRLPSRVSAMPRVVGPERRTMPIPPRPGGVAMAAMVVGSDMLSPATPAGGREDVGYRAALPVRRACPCPRSRV